MNSKPIPQICKRQFNQLLYAKSLPYRERHKRAVITETRTTTPKYQLDIYKQKADKVQLLSYKRYDKKTLRYIYNKYLANWDMAFRACLLRGVFFRNYNQAYRALRTMVEMGLLTKQGANFVKA